MTWLSERIGSPGSGTARRRSWLPHPALLTPGACLLFLIALGCSPAPHLDAATQNAATQNAATQNAATPVGHAVVESRHARPRVAPKPKHESVADALPPAEPPPPRRQRLPVGDSDVLLFRPAQPVDTPLPLVVVAHGAGGSPEWHCPHWEPLLGDHAYLLCLRGRSMRAEEPAHYFPHHHFVDEHLRAALEAVTDMAQAPNIDWSRSAFLGYSQGATMGSLVVPTLGQRFALLVLVEGGYEQWPAFAVRRYVKSGGKGAFFACGTRSCQAGARRSVRSFTQHGLLAEMSYSAGAGHTPAGLVGENAARGLLALWSALPDTASPAGAD